MAPTGDLENGLASGTAGPRDLNILRILSVCSLMNVRLFLPDQFMGAHMVGSFGEAPVSSPNMSPDRKISVPHGSGKKNSHGRL